MEDPTRWPGSRRCWRARACRRRRRDLAAVLPARARLRLQAGQLLVLPPCRRHACAAVVAEVHNTFGERHCYLLDGEDLAWGASSAHARCFHVSPFCEVQGGYRFRFHFAPRGATPRCLARIELENAAGQTLLTTSLSAPVAAPERAGPAPGLRWPMPLHEPGGGGAHPLAGAAPVGASACPGSPSPIFPPPPSRSLPP
jgi:hypothetical protein